MKDKEFRRFFITIMVVAVIVTGFLFWFLKDIAVPNTSIDDEDVEVIVISAEELINSFYNNEVKSDSEYIMNWLEIDGTIGNISGKGSKAKIKFYNGELFDFLSLTCYIEGKQEIDNVKELNQDERITVTGKLVRKFMGNLELRQCRIK